ncbi:hypothetical protein [Terrarubrum flagellatum]|uniref:hypothetical protein n=1 Tax=Terrirubrum flagellatum TaxID=2895980 RepID=UPI00314531A3
MAIRTVAAAAAVFLSVVSIDSASACNRGRETCSFKLFNNTAHALQNFWASPARITKWEEDILGRRTLAAGNEINVNMTDNRSDCIYDFKFKFDDGDELVRKAINVCKLGRYTLNE